MLSTTYVDIANNASEIGAPRQRGADCDDGAGGQGSGGQEPTQGKEGSHSIEI